MKNYKIYADGIFCDTFENIQNPKKKLEKNKESCIIKLVLGEIYWVPES